MVIRHSYRVNEEIRAREVLLIDADGRKVGVTPIEQALAIAQERGVDLVEIAPEANPAVCKVVDYGKYQYQLEKREKKQRKSARLKEMKFTIQTGEHDFKTKLSRIRQFLNSGDKVRVTIFFKGRQIIHSDKGREMLRRVVEETQDIAKVDQEAVSKGRTLQMLLTPLPRKGGKDEGKDTQGSG
ncbi:MAG: translation initiation factor IF-3 [Candidatus Bipolaricaulota bacterium]